MDTALNNAENENIISENEIKILKPKYVGASGLRELFINETKSMYYVKKALLKAFPKMIKNACTFELIEAITIYFEETKTQIIRLEDTFVALNENPSLERCFTIENLLQEADTIIEETKFGMVRDAGIVMALHKTAHYQLSTYSILTTFAAVLEEAFIIDLFADSLNESKVTELRLSKIANAIKF